MSVKQWSPTYSGIDIVRQLESTELAVFKISKRKTLHVHDIFCTNFTVNFMEDKNKRRQKFVSVSKLEYVSIGIKLQESSQTFDKVSELR